MKWPRYSVRARARATLEDAVDAWEWASEPIDGERVGQARRAKQFEEVTSALVKVVGAAYAAAARFEIDLNTAIKEAHDASPEA